MSAYAFGTTGRTSATVNGVTFQPIVIPAAGGNTTVGNVTLSESPATLLGSNVSGSSAAPFSGLSAGYQSLLSATAYAFENTTITLAVTGLQTGQSYQFEWWDDISGQNVAGQPSVSFLHTTATAVNGTTLTDNTTGTDGGLGQYAIGNFTAASGSAAVPEPTSLAVLGLGAAGILLRRRRQTATT